MADNKLEVFVKATCNRKTIFLLFTLALIVICCSPDNTSIIWNGILFDFSLDKYIAEQGDSIRIAIKIENLRNKTVDIEIDNDALRYDVFRDNVIVDHYPKVQFPGFISYELSRGESIDFSAIWNLTNIAGQQVSPGKYQLVAYIFIYRFENQILDSLDYPKFETTVIITD